MRTRTNKLLLSTSLVAGLGLVATGQTKAQTFTTLYSFAAVSCNLCANSDGAFPLGLIQSAPATAAEVPPHIAPAKTPAAIPWSQIGAKAGEDCEGDGLVVVPTAQGARLRCVFQRLDGAATPEGLWLTSTVTNTVNDRFRVVAISVGRTADAGNPFTSFSPLNSESPSGFGLRQSSDAVEAVAGRSSRQATDEVHDATALPRTGSVQVVDKLVRFLRPGLLEEYTVSMDGVRQDFVVLERPAGTGPLKVGLDVAGASVEPASSGARLVLEGSGRKIAYTRLRATDAKGKELTARMEAVSAEDEGASLISGCYKTPPPMLAVVVNDVNAIYPIRIDPTFSDANWISMGSIPGADFYVSAAVVDGLGNLYIGGSFDAVGDVLAKSIAKWNGSSWSALGSGMGRSSGDSPGVLALAVSGSDLYAGGFFTTAGGVAATNIAKWNGSSWSALGSGMGRIEGGLPAVQALAVLGTELYVGGYFTTAGGAAATNIAKWNGSSWSAVGEGMNDGVYALAVSGTDLYAGGRFTTAGSAAATYIAKWSGTSWSALGSGMNTYGGVYALAVSGSDLYAGGEFTTAGGVAANRIAKWNGTSWSALGLGMSIPPPYSPAVYALAVSGSDLYAGGYFTRAGGAPANSIAKWDGSTWSALGSGMNNSVRALAVMGSDLYSGGEFTTAGSGAANYIGKWNGSSWSAFGSGMNNSVLALAMSGNALYAGGGFITAGGVAANRIAKWNGSSWNALGSGMNSNVQALAVSGSNLYAGGYFTTAGGNAANYIAKWDGNSWSALGSGMDDIVDALAVSGSDLYAGGYFTRAGGITANLIAKWNGSSWSALGSGMNGNNVRALAVSGSNLYAGGYFIMAGTNTANYIAKWDGNSWSALGSGMDDIVDALAVSGSNLYAGGYFTTAGGVNIGRGIAKWNGSSWSALGSGMDHVVSALAVSSSDLYAGGYFTTAGGVNIGRGIAKWNGSSWSALGSGMNRSVYALAVSGTVLYAGGAFTAAGDKVSGYIARARIGSIATSLVATNSTASIQFSGVTGYQYDVQCAASLNSPITWTTVTTSPLSPAPDGSFSFTDTNGPPGTAYYRAVER